MKIIKLIKKKKENIIERDVGTIDMYKTRKDQNETKRERKRRGRAYTVNL